MYWTSSGELPEMFLVEPHQKLHFQAIKISVHQSRFSPDNCHTCNRYDIMVSVWLFHLSNLTFWPAFLSIISGSMGMIDGRSTVRRKIGRYPGIVSLASMTCRFRSQLRYHSVFRTVSKCAPDPSDVEVSNFRDRLTYFSIVSALYPTSSLRTLKTLNV